MPKQENDIKAAEDAKRPPASDETESEPIAGSAAAGATSSPKSSTATATANQDAIALLKADHRKVEQLFAQYEAAGEDTNRKSELVRQVCSELAIHTLIEEEIFYPACRQAASDEDPLDEAQVEHDSAKMLIEDLMKGDARDEYRDAKVKVLSEQIKHHVAEEEKPGSGIFAKAQATALDLQQLGQRLQQRKQALQQAAQNGRLPLSRPVSFQPGPTGPQQQENTMPRGQNDRDRDERGRFIDDDDRGARGYSAQRGGENRSFSNRDDDDDRRYGSRGSNDRDRDDRGRFMSDDDDGRGYGARGSNDRDRDSRGRFTDDDDRSYSARGSDDRDRDDRGRFTSDGGGYSSRGRSSRDDDDRGYSSRGSNDRDRDDRGRFTDDGRSNASQSGGRDRDSRGRYASDDDDDRRYGARGGGGGDGGRGWYGDSQGHAEAARQGWAERNGGGARARADDDDDRRGGSRSRGRDDDDGRGHGGWFGDSRGHAEAARRGWQDRR